MDPVGIAWKSIRIVSDVTQIRGLHRIQLYQEDEPLPVTNGIATPKNGLING